MGSRAFRAAFALPLVLALAGCEISVGNLAGRATDEWTRSYPLAAGGELQVGNQNGTVDIEGTDGTTVEVRAERIAKAATDAGARELLPRIKIDENVSANLVSIETEKMEGFMLGAAVEVRYHVKAPRGAIVSVTLGNGRISLTGLNGKVTAHTSNGAVTGAQLSGPVDAETTNGAVRVDLSAIGGPVTLRTTNGGVRLTLPRTANADLEASCVNGGINVSGLTLQASEQSRRRVAGKLNAGGPLVSLHTTNGGIQVESAK